ncbi:hypothetical protein CR513_55318, partial [Mucuna pruriens]
MRLRCSSTFDEQPLSFALPVSYAYVADHHRLSPAATVSHRLPSSTTVVYRWPLTADRRHLLLSVAVRRRPSSFTADHHCLSPPAADRRRKVVQYPVTKSRRLPPLLPLSAAVRCCLPPLDHRSSPQAHHFCLELLPLLLCHRLKVKVAIASFVSQGSTGIAVENSTMVASRGRGRSGWGTRGISRNGKGHLQNRCYDLIGWPDKIANISSSDTPSNRRTGSQLISNEEYQEFLRLKSNNHTQSSAPPSVSTACISQSMRSASDHIFGNEFVFSSISSSKFPNFISLANGLEYEPADWQRT